MRGGQDFALGVVRGGGAAEAEIGHLVDTGGSGQCVFVRHHRDAGNNREDGVVEVTTEDGLLDGHVVRNVSHNVFSYVDG